MISDTLRLISEDEVSDFWRDGVVCLRGIIDLAWLETLAEPIETLMREDARAVDLAAVAKALREGADLPMFGGRVAPGDLLEDEVVAQPHAAPKFFSLTYVHPKSAEIKRFEMESPLPAIAARLLRAQELNLFVDQVFVKEPATSTRTAFHVDESYFNLAGDQICTIWVPLDHVTRESSAMSYVRGSHRWEDSFLPNNFITQNVYEEGERGAGSRVRLPDIEGDPGRFDLVTYEVEPGDVIVHHTRTVHGSGGNTTLNRRRRALSVRYCGEDARWLKSAHFQGLQTVAGEPLTTVSDAFPRCWPRTGG